MIRLLVMSDLHLRNTIYTQGKKLEGDAEYAIEQIHRISEIVKPTAVIIAGDIFDRKSVDGTELYLAKKLMSAIKSKETPVLTIQGNHDVGDKSIIEVLSDTKNINNRIETIEGVTIGGLDWKHDTISILREKTKNPRPPAARPAPLGGVNILVLHESMRPFANFGNPNKLSIDDMPVNTLCIVGDTHLPEFITKTTDEGVKYVLSPGCLYPNNKTELTRESAAVWIVDVDVKDGIVLIETQKVPLRCREAYDLSNMYVDAVLETIANSEAPRALKTVLYVNRDDIKTILKAEKADRFVIAPVKKKREDDTKSTESVGMLSASFEDRLFAAVSVLDKNDAETCTKELVSLYNSDQLNAHIEKIIEEVSR